MLLPNRPVITCGSPIKHMLVACLNLLCHPRSLNGDLCICFHTLLFSADELSFMLFHDKHEIIHLHR